MSRSLNGFTMLEKIGSGKQGKVYRGMDGTGKNVAIKLMEQPASPGDQAHLRQELEALRRLRGTPNIINLLADPADVDVPRKYPARHPGEPASRRRLMLVMELALGGELFEYLSVAGNLPEPLARYYALQLFQAIAAAHAAGVAHRDLKPENLLLSGTHDLVVADFGLASVQQVQGGAALARTFCGTFKGGYLAAEVLYYHRHRGYDAQVADAWSCAVVLFIMLSGFPPFGQAAVNDWWWDRLREGRSDLFWQAHERQFAFSQRSKDLLTRMLSVNPSTRLKVSDALAHDWFSGPVPAVEAVRTEMTRRQRLIRAARAPAPVAPPAAAPAAAVLSVTRAASDATMSDSSAAPAAAASPVAVAAPEPRAAVKAKAMAMAVAAPERMPAPAAAAAAAVAAPMAFRAVPMAAPPRAAPAAMLRMVSASTSASSASSGGSGGSGSTMSDATAHSGSSGSGASDMSRNSSSAGFGGAAAEDVFATYTTRSAEPRSVQRAGAAAAASGAGAEGGMPAAAPALERSDEASEAAASPVALPPPMPQALTLGANFPSGWEATVLLAADNAKPAPALCGADGAPSSPLRLQTMPEGLTTAKRSWFRMPSTAVPALIAGKLYAAATSVGGGVARVKVAQDADADAGGSTAVSVSMQLPTASAGTLSLRCQLYREPVEGSEEGCLVLDVQRVNADVFAFLEVYRVIRQVCGALAEAEDEEEDADAGAPAAVDVGEA